MPNTAKLGSERLSSGSLLLLLLLRLSPHRLAKYLSLFCSVQCDLRPALSSQDRKGLACRQAAARDGA